MFKKPARMPQSTSTMTDHLNQSRSQHTHPQQYSAVSESNSLASKSPVQRVDSFETSYSSLDPQSSLSLESPFTPDDYSYSADLQLSALDAHWKDAQLEHDINEFQDSHMVMETNGFTHTVPSGLASHRTSLSSPQSTNTSTPQAFGHSRGPSQNSTLMTSPMSTPVRGERQHCSVDAAGMNDLHRLATPLHASQITSPTIRISSHSRDGSPVPFEQTRINKKRSASNLSQGEYFPDVSDAPHSAMLGVPQYGHETEYIEEDQVDLRTGISPTQRGNEQLPSLTDMQQTVEHAKTVADVGDWLQAISLHPTQARYARGSMLQDRIRSRSTGAQSRIIQRPILQVRQVVGPGVVIDERSDYYYSSDEDSNAELQPDDHPVHPKVEIPHDEEENIAPDDTVTALPLEYHRPAPWHDPYPVQTPDIGKRYQPATSNAAIQKFNARNREFDTLSRSATWGTTNTVRRLSDGDQDSMFEAGKVRHHSLSSKARIRGSSLLGKVKGSIKRSNSRGRRNEADFTADLEKVQSPEPLDDGSSTDSQPKPSRPSFSRAKSPSIIAGLRGTTASLTAVGGPTSLNVDTHPQSHSGNMLNKMIRRVRSKSDVNKSPKSPAGLTSMLTQAGGMPVPNITSHAFEEPNPVALAHTPIAAMTVSQHPTPSPITMPLSPRPANVMPNMEGFRVQIKELNPMLTNFLVDRIAHDQVRRYKRLVKSRVDHIQNWASGNCASGSVLCSQDHGESELLPPRSAGKDTAGHTKTHDSDEEEFDGCVTAAAFPEGIPLPPARRLPAKFECPLCFQVKVFNKPSDWTKHVHEDVQPFTCTFDDCAEPRSFKRKADWVRHENERHRHLEWWQCNITECAHKCYRKDNFVQHLVREHKRKEPKPNRRGNANGKGKAKTAANSFSPEEQEFWQVVDDCRRESILDARKEPCPFCRNTCTSWKKLSVHVGKHMEQIAMPVLELVSLRRVTKDTIVSPVEPLPTMGQQYSVSDVNAFEYGTHLSPFSPSNHSYNNSSAEQSPHVQHNRVLPRSDVTMSSAGDIQAMYPHQAQRPVDMTYMYHDVATGITYDPMHGLAPSHFGHFGDPITFQAVQYSGAEHVLGSNTGFVNVFNDQQQYLSSPVQQFSNFQMNGYLPNHIPMQMQAPVPSHPVDSGSYSTQHQDQWQHQDQHQQRQQYHHQ